jgi:hypothetical protein
VDTKVLEGMYCLGLTKKRMSCFVQQYYGQGVLLGLAHKNDFAVTAYVELKTCAIWYIQVQSCFLFKVVKSYHVWLSVTGFYLQCRVTQQANYW